MCNPEASHEPRGRIRLARSSAGPATPPTSPAIPNQTARPGRPAAVGALDPGGGTTARSVPTRRVARVARLG